MLSFQLLQAKPRGPRLNRSQSLLTYAEPNDPRVRQLLIRSIERLSGQPRIARLYEEARSKSIDRARAQDFFSEALCALELKVVLRGAHLDSVPSSGPLMFVANHPFGVADGLALCTPALRCRPSMKVMIHRALFRDEALQPFMLPVDFSGTREAAKRNIQVRDEAIQYLQGGGTVTVFPGGGISTAQGLFGPAVDLEWKLLPARLVQASRCTVIPVFFPGQNSRLFQWVSQFSETLRLSMVIRELDARRGGSIEVVVGQPLPFTELERFPDRKVLMRHLRHEVYRLGVAGPVSES